MNNLEKYRFPIVYVTIIVGIFLSLSIPHLTKYTEIDWEAYMSEVRGPFVENNWNYTQLKGDTGPLGLCLFVICCVFHSIPFNNKIPSTTKKFTPLDLYIYLKY